MSTTAIEQEPVRIRNTPYAFVAGFLSWTFDSFDFFTLTYVLTQIAKEFQRPISDVALLLTASLVMRPAGAILCGLLGDRFGRRRPLMALILVNSTISVLCGFAPSYRTLLLLRSIFGIGMGGVWGLAASLAMESVPREKRGKFSGILQEGYALGNLLAGVAFWTVFPHFGWRSLFFLSVVPNVFTAFLLLKVDKDHVSKAAVTVTKNWGSYFQTIGANVKRLLYLVVLMSMMGFLSHGTQDLYPTFLQKQIGLSSSVTAIISVISMLGAIVGGTLGGIFSDRLGRRRTMISAEICALFLIPLWLFSHSLALIAVGAFMMQSMVQAAWGVIPAHVNELTPDSARVLLSGFAYQVGMLVASTAPFVEAVATRHFSYAQAMGTVVAIVVVVGVVVIGVGPEARHVMLGRGGPGETT